MTKDRHLLSRIATVAAAFIALTFATGSHCGNENSVTGPTPFDISGNWAGTFVTRASANCSPATVSLTLTVSQTGSLFNTDLSGLPCDFGGGFSGFIGSSVAGVATASGSVKQGGPTAPFGGFTGTFTGTVSSSNIHLVISDLVLGGHPYSDIPGGTLDLHR